MFTTQVESAGQPIDQSVRSGTLHHALSIRQLEVFHAVVQGGSLAAAARSLLARHSTVSYEISNLEALVGTQLLVRHGRGVTLTAEGEVIYEYARRVLAVIDETALAIRQLRDLQRGCLTIGAYGTYGTYTLPHILGRFKRQFPNVELHVETLGSHQIMPALYDHAVEMVIAPEWLRVLDDSGQVVRETFDRHEFVIVASPDHPLASRKHITPRELSIHPFVVREPSSWPSHLFTDVIASMPTPPPIALKFNTLEPVKQAVIAGMGLAFIGRCAVAGELQRGELVVLDVEGFPVYGIICVAHLRSRRLSFAGRALRDFLLALRGPRSLTGQA